MDRELLVLRGGDSRALWSRSGVPNAIHRLSPEHARGLVEAVGVAVREYAMDPGGEPLLVVRRDIGQAAVAGRTAPGMVLVRFTRGGMVEREGLLGKYKIGRWLREAVETR